MVGQRVDNVQISQKVCVAFAGILGTQFTHPCANQSCGETILSAPGHRGCYLEFGKSSDRPALPPAEQVVFISCLHLLSVHPPPTPAQFWSSKIYFKSFLLQNQMHSLIKRRSGSHLCQVEHRQLPGSPVSTLPLPISQHHPATVTNTHPQLPSQYVCVPRHSHLVLAKLECSLQLFKKCSCSFFFFKSMFLFNNFASS